MRWYIVKKSVGYKILYAARPPVAEGPTVSDHASYNEANVAVKALLDFDAGLPTKGNA